MKIMTAFTAASLFAVHPALTEAVGYVSSRSELLCGCLFLAAMLCFVNMIFAARFLEEGDMRRVVLSPTLITPHESRRSRTKSASMQ